MGIKSIWLKALLFFLIFVAVWLLLDLVAGGGVSSRGVFSAVIAGVIAATISFPLTNLCRKRRRKT
jgi:hypothetical protein